MSKIAINNLNFYYSDYYKPIFENVNLVLDTDWKLGLIGRNGRGKSTFLNLLLGKLKTTGGSIHMTVNMEYFPYELNQKYTVTMDVIKEAIGGLKTMENTMEQIITESDEARFQEYSEIQTKYSELGGYEMEGRILKEMADMGLGEELAYRDYETLSGGEKTRMMIIALFLRKNSFVLLDEPTNHLDITGKERMAEYLSKKKGFIVVSHDRDFLDKVTDHILSINKADIKVEKGNYSSWRKNMDLIEEYEFRTRDRLEREIKQLERRSKQSRDWAGTANTQKYAFTCHARTNGCQAYMRRAKRSEEQILDNIDEKKQLLLNYEEAKELTISQREGDIEGCLIKVKNLSFSYPGGRRIIKDFTLNLHKGDRIWIKGQNGAGKSTLLKLLAGELGMLGPDIMTMGCPEECKGIERAGNLQISVSGQEPLWTEGFITEKYQLPEQRKQLEQLAYFCALFDLPEEFLERPLETYSSGELKKVDVARALSEENDVIFLDEPLNYMDVYFREQLEKAILAYGPTIVFVEHDARFGKNVSNKVIEL